MKNFLDGWKWFNYNSFIFKEQKSILKSPDSEPEQSGSPADGTAVKRIREMFFWTDSRKKRESALEKSGPVFSDGQPVWYRDYVVSGNRDGFFI